MTVNLNKIELITVTRVIAHKVSAKKKDKDAEAELSEELLSFDSKDQQILIDRLTDALLNTTKTFQLDYEDLSKNSVYDILHNKYSSFEEADFIEFSQDLAERMAESHFRVKIPGGYSIIGDGKTKDGEIFFFIIKAELQEAFNIQKNKLNLIHDIFLSPAKDFYKIGFFLKRSGKFIPFMYDDIFTPQKKDLTEYFYGKFLGLTTDSNDIIRTKNFYEDVKIFLMNEIDNTKDRVAMEKTLNSYIREDVSGVISATEFSDKYFEGDVKKKFQKKICEIYPHSFTKNKRLLDRKLELERVVVHVSSEITLVGNTCSLQDIEMSRLNTDAEKNKAIHSINSGKHKTIVLL